MAKTTKGGLGRGLNSLISGSMEEALPAETAQARAAQVRAAQIKAEHAKERSQVSFEDEAKELPKAAEAATEAKEQVKQVETLQEKPSSEPQREAEAPSATVVQVQERGQVPQHAREKEQGQGRVLQQEQGQGRVLQQAPAQVPQQVQVQPKAQGPVSQQTPAQTQERTRPQAQVPQRTQVSKTPKLYFEEDDHVVIKSIKERAADEVAISSIKPNPDQPRTNFKQEELEELAASIEKEGLLQPILVRPVGKSYQIIAGERRWQACRMLGMKTIPVRIREADDDKALELALIENLHREDLNPIEEAYGYRRLMERRSMTHSEIAETVAKSRSTVANALRLLELPEEAQQLLFEEKISAGHARAILSIPTNEGRRKLTERLVKEKISVREAETIARLFAGVKSKEEIPERPPVPKSFKVIARALCDVLQTNVRVKNIQGKNKIEIEFKDEEDLERLFDIMTAAEIELD